MNENATPAAPAALPDQPMPVLLRVMHELIEVEVDLVRQVQSQAKAEIAVAVRVSEPALDFTVATTRMSRLVRQSVMLAHRIGQPVKPVAESGAEAGSRGESGSGPDRVAVRKQIIRAVEDCIERDAPAEAADRLRAEFLEPLDSPELV